MKENKELYSVGRLITDTGFINYILGSDAGQEKLWQAKESRGEVSQTCIGQARDKLLGLFRPGTLTRDEKDEMMNRILKAIK